MKKLFLFFILSFFSAQGLAGGCPDGSDPVKSISADGTYFVYNCGSDSNDSNESSHSSSSEIKSFENHIKASVDLNVPIIVHSRNAESKTFEILYKYRKENLKILKIHPIKKLSRN